MRYSKTSKQTKRNNKQTKRSVDLNPIKRHIFTIIVVGYDFSNADISCPEIFVTQTDLNRPVDSLTLVFVKTIRQIRTFTSKYFYLIGKILSQVVQSYTVGVDTGKFSICL